MPSNFQYRPRDVAVIQRHAAGTNDFESFIRDDVAVYKARNGDNCIRILPPTWDEAEYYGLDIHAHYGLGPDRASALCLNKMGGGRCPICEARSHMERAGDQEGADEIKPTRRMLVWIIDQLDPDIGPQVWAMPKTVDRDISGVSIDKRDGTVYMIDDPEGGFDIMFMKHGEQRNTRYTSVQLARTPTSIDPAAMDYVVENPLPDLLIWRTYEEVLALYEGGPPPVAGAEGDPSGSAPPPPAPRQYGRQAPAPAAAPAARQYGRQAPAAPAARQFGRQPAPASQQRAPMPQTRAPAARAAAPQQRAPMPQTRAPAPQQQGYGRRPPAPPPQEAYQEEPPTDYYDPNDPGPEAPPDAYDPAPPPAATGRPSFNARPPARAPQPNASGANTAAALKARYTR